MKSVTQLTFGDAGGCQSRLVSATLERLRRITKKATGPTITTPPTRPMASAAPGSAASDAGSESVAGGNEAADTEG